MKITVDRREENTELIFTIRVSEPHAAPFGEIEQKLIKDLEELDNFAENSEIKKSLKNKIKQSVHGTKDIIFSNVLENLKFSIQNELEVKFNPICQEIYNWIYDYQDGNLKKWMQEFDPQRVKYYFDNDRTVESDYGEDDDG